MQKRSLTIAGHQTSIALEAEFWDGLADMAAAQEITIIQLIEMIDQQRQGPNLSSALRVAVLRWYRAGVAER